MRFDHYREKLEERFRNRRPVGMFRRGIWEPLCRDVVRVGLAKGSQHGSRVMKKAQLRRNRRNAKIARLRRQLDLCFDSNRPRSSRTRAARYAASLAEQLGLLTRARCCTWCRRRLRLERHHWDYNEPLNITYLCRDCHEIADTMVYAESA